MKSEMLLKRFHDGGRLMLQAGLILGAALLALALGGCKNPAGGGEDGPRYTITFDADGGAFESSEAPARTALEGAALGEESMPAPPTKPGYTFSGWYTGLYGGGSAFDFSTPVTGDITVYAKWSSGAAVTFDADGGSPSGQLLTVSPGAALGAASMPPEPAKAGFAFNGWWTEKEGGGTEFTQETPVTADITLYAKWIAFRTVSFDADGGEPSERSLAVASGEAAGAEAVTEEPEKEGFSFGGWWTEKEGAGERFTAETLITADIAVYAKWIPMDSGVTVTFDAAGGTPSGRQRTVSPGAALGAEDLPGDPAKSGHKFLGWYMALEGGGEQFTQETPVTANITVYAKWIPVWNVTFDVDGGSPKPKTQIVVDGETLGEAMPGTPSRNNLNFHGWYYNGDNGEEVQLTADTPVTKNIDARARWRLHVIFDPDGGIFADDVSESKELDVPPGHSLHPLPVLRAGDAASGAAFGGWYTEKNGLGKKYDGHEAVNDHITLYAKWAYNVTFNAGTGGYPESQTLMIAAGAPAGENLPAAAREYYDFLGWYTEAGGGETQFTAETLVTADINVYAKWLINSYLVSFEAEGGDPPYQSIRVPVNSTLDITKAGVITAPTKGVSASVEAWYYMKDGREERFSKNTVITDHITLYAKWIRSAYIDLAFTPEDEAGAGWTYNSATKVYTILDGAAVTVTGKTTERRIVVASGAKAEITLQDADIQVPGNPPLDIIGAEVMLKLAGTNVLKVSSGSATGIKAPESSKLIITSAVGGDGSEAGSLTASGAGIGAGIGGQVSPYYRSESNGGDITIRGGTIIATGTHSGAGIGGGGSEVANYWGSNGIVTITGGKVTARSYNDCAAIGGGRNGHGGTVHITGGIVEANGRTGIGAALGGMGGSVTISGGTVTASNDNGDGAGLGWESGSGGTITINGGTVTATGRGAGIGGTTNGGTITIGGGTVSASGGNGIGGTNGGTITITGGSVKASKVLSPPVNGGGAPVYLNTLTVGAPPLNNTPIIAPSTIDGSSSYGINGVKTDADGKVYFWLPENAAENASVSLTADGGAVYNKSYPRTSAGNTETLQ